jgi:hypothetical protein
LNQVDARALASSHFKKSEEKRQYQFSTDRKSDTEYLSKGSQNTSETINITLNQYGRKPEQQLPRCSKETK